MAAKEKDESSSKQPDVSTKEPSPPLRTFSWTYWLILTTVVASLVFYFVRGTARAKAEASKPVFLLDAQFGFTPAGALETLRALNPKGRAIYKELNMVDFLIAPVVFREYLINTFPATTTNRDSVRDMLANTYLIGDLLENICVSIMLKTYPRMIDIVAWIGCAGNVTKNISFMSAIAAVLYEGYIWIRKEKVKTQ